MRDSRRLPRRGRSSISSKSLASLLELRNMERRLAAIVCADVAGYSRMMGADEAGTHAAFKAHRGAIHPVILNHGGRLMKTTGDGFLLEFPSVVGAIEAAIAMQNLMAERNAHLPAERITPFRLAAHM